MIYYAVDKDNRKVTAFLKDTKYDAVDMICRLEEVIPFGFPDSFACVATCSEEDKWDENIGKNLAKKRCMAKYYDKKIDVLMKELDSQSRYRCKLVREVEKLKKVRENYIV